MESDYDAKQDERNDNVTNRRAEMSFDPHNYRSNKILLHFQYKR